MRIQVEMSGGMFSSSWRNRPFHWRFVIPWKGPLRLGRGLSWVNIKQLFLPPPPTPRPSITAQVVHTQHHPQGGGGRGGLCLSSSVQMDRVREYPAVKWRQRVTTVDYRIQHCRLKQHGVVFLPETFVMFHRLERTLAACLPPSSESTPHFTVRLHSHGGAGVPVSLFQVNNIVKKKKDFETIIF